MNAYQRGRQEAGTRRDRIRVYETDKAEKRYWQGYTDAMRASLKEDEMLVRCEREGRIFAAKKDSQSIDCPTCGRRYILEDGHYESDRRLTLL